MQVRVAVIGKPRDAALGAAIREYETRAARYWPLKVVEVREESARHLTAEQVLDREGAKLVDQLPAGGRWILCDPGGEQWSSEHFARFLQDQREASRDLGFVIGGAFGIGAPVRTRPHQRLSLAPWTLPHEMARLVLAEQLYRAGTILRGEPYHK